METDKSVKANLGKVIYPLLPVPIDSSEWKGSAMIRGVLDDMTVCAGYGKYGVKLGVGEPPLGWPHSIIAWKDYCGASRSKLSNKGWVKIVFMLFLHPTIQFMLSDHLFIKSDKLRV